MGRNGRKSKKASYSLARSSGIYLIVECFTLKFIPLISSYLGFWTRQETFLIKHLLPPTLLNISNYNILTYSHISTYSLIHFQTPDDDEDEEEEKKAKEEKKEKKKQEEEKKKEKEEKAANKDKDKDKKDKDKDKDKEKK